MAETEMVERVATALHDCYARQEMDWDVFARAAIEAMREPTEEMLFAADWLGSGTREAYGNMIDAALSPPSKD